MYTMKGVQFRISQADENFGWQLVTKIYIHRQIILQQSFLLIFFICRKYLVFYLITSGMGPSILSPFTDLKDKLLLALWGVW